MESNFCRHGNERGGVAVSMVFTTNLARSPVLFKCEGKILESLSKRDMGNE